MFFFRKLSNNSILPNLETLSTRDLQFMLIGILIAFILFTLIFLIRKLRKINVHSKLSNSVVYIRSKWSNFRSGVKAQSLFSPTVVIRNLSSNAYSIFFNLIWLSTFLLVFWFWFHSEFPNYVIRPDNGTAIDLNTTAELYEPAFTGLSLLIGIILFNLIGIILRFFILIVFRDSHKYYYLRKEPYSAMVIGIIAIVVLAFMMPPRPAEGIIVVTDENWSQIRLYVIESVFLGNTLLILVMGSVVAAFLMLLLDYLTRNFAYHFIDKEISLTPDDQTWLLFSALEEDAVSKLRAALKTALVDETVFSSINSLKEYISLIVKGGVFSFNLDNRGPNPCYIYILQYFLTKDKVCVGIAGFHETHDTIESADLSNRKVKNVINSIDLEQEPITNDLLIAKLRNELHSEIVSLYNPPPVWIIGIILKIKELILHRYENTIAIRRRRKRELAIKSQYLKDKLAPGLQEKALEPKKPSTPYIMLENLEQTLRTFIVSHLEGMYGKKWWKQRIPNDIRENCQDRKENKENIYPWFGEKDYDLIEYADFSDYARIIERRDNWREVFKPIIRKKEEFILKLRELEPIRNKIAHNRPLNKIEKQTLSLYSQQIRNVCVGIYSEDENSK